MQEEVLRVIDQIKKETDYFAKARLISFLVKQKQIRIKDLASSLQMKPSYLCHIMRLNKLSEVVMDGYYSKLITISHLFVLSLLKSEEDILSIYEMVLRDSLTVIQTEELVREKLHHVSSEGEYVTKEEIAKAGQEALTQYESSMKCIQTRVKTKILFEWSGSREKRRQHVQSFLRVLSKNQTNH